MENTAAVYVPISEVSLFVTLIPEHKCLGFVRTGYDTYDALAFLVPGHTLQGEKVKELCESGVLNHTVECGESESGEK